MPTNNNNNTTETSNANANANTNTDTTADAKTKQDLADVRPGPTHQNPTSKAAGTAGAPAKQVAREETELAVEELYKERMEDEYAKREGGA